MKLKCTSLLCSFLLGSAVFAQSGDNIWKKFAPLKFGVGAQTMSFDPVFENFLYTQIDNIPNNSAPLTETSDNSFTVLRVPFEVEYFADGWYIKNNADWASDIIRDAVAGLPQVGGDGHRVLRIDLFPTHLGFGGWVNNKIAIYGGAQYSYTFHRFRSPDHNQVGGNQRGFHGMALYNLGRVLLKAHVQYDWVRHSKKLSKGDAQNLDLDAYFAFNESNSSGFWASVRFKRTFSEGLSGLPNDDWAIDLTSISRTTEYTFPDVTANEVYLRAGIYFNLNKN